MQAAAKIRDWLRETAASRGWTYARWAKEANVAALVLGSYRSRSRG